MKISKKLALLALTSAGLIGLVGCKSNAKMPVNFVAVTSSDYNASIQFGNYDYKFQGKINQGSNTFKLTGSVAQRHIDGGQGGRMGPPSAGDETPPKFVGFGPEENSQGGQQGQGGQQQGGDPFNPGGQGGQQGDPTNPGSGDPSNPGSGDPTNPGAGDPTNPDSGDPSNPGGGNPGGDFGGGGFGGGGFGGGGQQQSKTLESITVDTSKVEVFINEIISPFTCLPEGSSGDVEWTTSNDKVATVNGGSITPVGVGTVTITGTGKTDSSKSASITLTVKEENLRQYDWSISGTYVYEKGYGYKIVFNDESKTEVHTDFDRTEGRHEFYYRVKIGEKSEVLKFQAKDPTFKDSLAKDYKKWDERDAQYTFYAKATGNNNSVATAYMYLHKTNNEVTLNTPNGANRSLSFGMKWEQRGEQIVVKDGDAEYVSDKSVNPEHPGYRLVYGGNAYYLSSNPEVKWKKLTMEDFDGQTTHEFTGSYSAGMFGGEKEVNLNLGADGVSRLYIGTPAPSFKGTWTANNGDVSITIGEHTAQFTKGADDKLSIVVRIEVETNNPFMGGKEVSTKYVTMTQVK